MKRLFMICLLSAAAVVQTGFCKSILPVDGIDGNDGDVNLQIIGENDASTNDPAIGYYIAEGELGSDSACTLFAWNRTAKKIGVNLVFRFYDSSEWHNYYFEMAPYQGKSRIKTFSRLIIIDENNEDTGFKPVR